MDHLIHRLNSSRNVLITTHASPDGDAIGSLLAMNLALQGTNKRITLYNESPIPAVYRFLPRVQSVISHLDPAASFDAAVVLDCGDLTRIGDAAGIGGREQQITDPGAFALSKLARTFGQHVAGDPRCEGSQSGQPRPAIARDGRSLGVALDGVVVNGHSCGLRASGTKLGSRGCLTRLPGISCRLGCFESTHYGRSV